MSKQVWSRVLGLLILLLAAGCAAQQSASVVVYTSVDQPYSEPILKAFEEQTGILVRAIYDTEATKTTGLVSRLVAERRRPQADVFWSSEIAQTLWLREQDLLARYTSPVARDIPAAYRDPDGFWTGMGLRARILLVNTDRLSASEYPDSIYDLLDPHWQPGEVGLANPLFGTTATHAAALYAALEPGEARAYFEALRDRGVRVLDGNSVVRDLVANGDLAAGLTDTDDAYVAVRQGKPVEIIFPDQDGLGTLLIPNTVALVAAAPHSKQGQALIDYLLSQEVEKLLMEREFLYASVRSVDDHSDLVCMDVSWAEVAGQIDQMKSDMKEIFLR